MTIVDQEDQSQVIWPFWPMARWATGVDNPLHGTPNGEPLTTHHGGGHIWKQDIETHSPCQLGSGWPVVNGGSDDLCWDQCHQAHVPVVPTLPTYSFGVQQKIVHSPEFGAIT